MGRIMKGRSVSMEIKRDLTNSVIVPTLTYASKTWAWNERQRVSGRGEEVTMSVYKLAKMPN